MVAKAIQAKTWNLQPSFDGLLYSAYPNGDKPSGYQSAPTLLATDIVSGSTTGGENNKGAYLSLFGYSFGLASRLGTATGARVYMRSVSDGIWREVDNYRALIKSRTYDVNQVVQIICQVGALGGKTGYLDIKVTVNGVDTNILANGFFVQPGRIAFISLTGNDNTGLWNSISQPFRYLQRDTGVINVNTNFQGLWADQTPMGEVGLQPGDTLVLRGGNWTDAVGWEGKWCRTYYHGGCAPRGTAQTYRKPTTGIANNGSGLIRLSVASTTGMTTGEWCMVTGMDDNKNGSYQITVVDSTHVDLQGSVYVNANLNWGAISNGSGYIHITRYPGPPLAHAPEVVSWTGGDKGGIHGGIGNDRGRGWGRYYSISGLIIATPASASAADAAPLNLQNGADFWRVFDNDLSWPSSLDNASAGGVAGVSDSGVISFNKIHDIGAGGVGTLRQNHGVYLGGYSGSTYQAASNNCEVSYNWIKDITGGTGIQCYWSGDDTFNNNRIHHNFIDTTAKYGINFADQTLSGEATNNVVCNTAASGIRFNVAYGTINIKILYNTVYNCSNANGYGAIQSDWNVDSANATISIRHNVIVLGSTRSGGGLNNSFYGSNLDTGITMAKNLWFDELGLVTAAPGKDATGIYADPLFVSPVLRNFTVKTGSPTLGASTANVDPITVSTDFYGMTRPGGLLNVNGGNDLGAMQGVGV